MATAPARTGSGVCPHVESRPIPLREALAELDKLVKQRPEGYYTAEEIGQKFLGGISAIRVRERIRRLIANGVQLDSIPGGGCNPTLYRWEA